MGKREMINKEVYERIQALALRVRNGTKRRSLKESAEFESVDVLSPRTQLFKVGWIEGRACECVKEEIDEIS